MNETGLSITFEKQPILLNMIVSGYFRRLFQEKCIHYGSHKYFSVCLDAISGQRTVQHMNVNPDQHKRLLEKTKWGYIQRDYPKERICSKKAK